jgi:hypothetical protein
MAARAGLVALAAVSAAVLLAASVAPQARAGLRSSLSVSTPPSGAVAVAVVRFELAPGKAPPTIQLTNHYGSPARAALVAGVSRWRGSTTTFTALVAVVGFPTDQAAATEGYAVADFESDDPFTLEYQGVARGSCRSPRCGLASLEGRARGSAWRSELAVLPSPSIDPGYRTGGELLEQIADLLVGAPGRGFLRALSASSAAPVVAAPSPGVAPAASAANPGLGATAALSAQADGSLELRIDNTGATAITSVTLQGIDFTILSLAPSAGSQCSIAAPGIVCAAGFAIPPGQSFEFTVATYTCCLISGEVWVNSQPGSSGQLGPIMASLD